MCVYTHGNSVLSRSAIHGISTNTHLCTLVYEYGVRKTNATAVKYYVTLVEIKTGLHMMLIYITTFKPLYIKMKPSLYVISSFARH